MTDVMALYIEDNSIRLLVAKGRKVERWEAVALEPGLVSSGMIQNEVKVAEKVKEIFTNINRGNKSNFISGYYSTSCDRFPISKRRS